MVTKKSGESFEAEFRVSHVDEHIVRMAHDDSVSFINERRRGATKLFQVGDVVEVTYTKREPAPDEGRITVEMDAADAHTLPDSAEGVKGKK